jgi:hypothetical protein
LRLHALGTAGIVGGGDGQAGAHAEAFVYIKAG